MSRDARTTPGWLRIPILAGLLALGGYNVWCWKNALGQGEPSFPRWLATWQMFTLRDPTHSHVYAEARIGDTWQDVDLEALFPTRWESGPPRASAGMMGSGASRRMPLCIGFDALRTSSQGAAGCACGRAVSRRRPRRPRGQRFFAAGLRAFFALAGALTARAS